MKKTTYLVLGSICLSTLLWAPSAVQAADGGVYDSNGQIIFEPSTEPVNPVDPTDPEKPVTPVDPTDPEKPVNPGTNGPLSIDYASSLDFGTQKITSKNETYTAKTQKYKDQSGNTKEGPNFVQVSDARGTEKGWKLTVKQNGQFKSESAKELTGAQVSFKNGTIVTASNSAKPTATASFELQPTGAEATVTSAQEGQGAGTYLTTWGTDATTGAESISLFVPGSTTKYAEKYSTTFTWTLSDVPGN